MAHHLLRAQLSNHRACGGHVIPHTVKISFPPQKTELTLNFKGIEPNCQVADALWTPPGGDRIAQLIWADMSAASRRYSARTEGAIIGRSPNVPQDDTMLDGNHDMLCAMISDEPDFDPLEPSDESLIQTTSRPTTDFSAEGP